MFSLAKFSNLLSGGAARGTFPVNAVDFDGTNDYLTRGAGLTGASDGKQGTFSAWVRIDGGDGTTMDILTSATTLGGGTLRTEVFRDNSGQFRAMGNSAAGTQILLMGSTGTYAASATWLHVLMSWNLASAGARHIYINDASGTSEFTFTNTDIDYTVADWAVGARPNNTVKFNGCMAEVFFHTTYLDITTEANRRKFISSSLTPVDLGANGSTPLGVQPLIYLKGLPASFGTNSGSGGNFTITGTLDLASTSPSD